jgi:hypothetical protein
LDLSIQERIERMSRRTVTHGLENTCSRAVLMVGQFSIHKEPNDKQT